MLKFRTPQGNNSALFVFFIGALLWGVYWVPLRTLAGLGLPGPWASFTLIVSGLIPSLILVIVRERRGIGLHQVMGALGIGVAFGLYSVALVYSDVVRVILIFYFAPIWSAIIESMFFGRRWTWRTTLALLVSIAGIVLICRGEVPLEGTGAIGDWMALAAGLAWSIGAALVFSKDNINLPVLTATTLCGATIVTALCVLLLPHGTTTATAAVQLETLIPVALLFGVFYMLPSTLATLWGAASFPPTIITFVMTAEIVSGVASSALFLGEPFGVPEIIGTMLIAIGVTIEVVLAPRAAALEQGAGEAI